ncbi:hypothetical protein BD289DRAFT_436895 [Coniella lustricola]|uniref:Uncharacterized protein n=1 Tax=Coniella lustricola TaxID=2025994 RepID=A0A2T3A4R3_9PEZI|nr:hypothetical protein BD289DRAFT_436895 [Coniella lustricola]
MHNRWITVFPSPFVRPVCVSLVCVQSKRDARSSHHKCFSFLVFIQSFIHSFTSRHTLQSR